MYDLRGYIDNEKFVVNLDCQYEHLLVSLFIQQEGGGVNGDGRRVSFFSHLISQINTLSEYMEIWCNIQIIIYRLLHNTLTF